MITLLNTFHLEDMNNPSHPSVLFKEEDYLLFIYRLPVDYREDLEELVVSSGRYAIFGKRAYRYDEAASGIVELDGGTDELYELVDKETDKVMKLVDEYLGEVSDLEAELLDKKIASAYMERWFYLKKDLNRIERLIIPAIKSIDELIKEFSKREDPLVIGFKDIKEHLERSHRFAFLNMKKLDEIYAFYSSLTSEKMNRIVYLLAIVSAIFLPLNFIVSFFGINTSGLFLTDGTNGTVVVLWIIGGVMATVGMLLYLFRKRIF